MKRRSLARVYGWKNGAPLLIVLASAMLVFGLTLPLLNVEKLLWDRDYSVAAGVFGLWHDRAWLLAAVVFFFSVVFPIAKLLLLAVKLGPLADVEPRAGVYWFCSAIVCSMLATAVVRRYARA